MNKNDIQASPAQLRYADTLFYGSLIGFVIMLITYVLYVTGILTRRSPWTTCRACGPAAPPITVPPAASRRAGAGWPSSARATSATLWASSSWRA